MSDKTVIFLILIGCAALIASVYIATREVEVFPSQRPEPWMQPVVEPCTECGGVVYSDAPWYVHSSGLCQTCFESLETGPALEAFRKPIQKEIDYYMQTSNSPRLKDLLKRVEETLDTVKGWVE